MTHANAPLTPAGRLRLARCVVDDGWSLRRAAERFHVAPATAKRWADRYRNAQSLQDRSSRPQHSPNQLPTRTERRIIGLRFTHRWGPHRIGYHLNIPRSSVGRVLARYHMPRLADLDQATGLPIRRPKPVRYEKATPGELVHVDIKKLGRIPEGGGWRAHGHNSNQARTTAVQRVQTRRKGAPSSRGYRYLHHAIDDHSRYVYSEICDDERKETAAAFITRAIAFFANLDITVTAVMTDNGSCYRSHLFAAALGEHIKHRRTRPYRPQTNGKVERFNRTLATEWAYAHPYTSEHQREQAYTTWLHHYKHHRAHTGINGDTPSDRVHNLTGNNT